MLVLLLPTMIWVRLKVPWAKRLVEFLCLLPLTIPAIVIVVGISNVMAWVNYLVTEGPLALAFPYVILVLPYSYRALDAGLSSIDVNTLSEAARSLGASWFTVITRVIIPNVKSAVLSAAFLAVAVVLGEYTFASLLHYDTLQVAIAQYGLSNARVAMSASLATLAFAALLLFGLSLHRWPPQPERGASVTSSTDDVKDGTSRPAGPGVEVRLDALIATTVAYVPSTGST